MVTEDLMNTGIIEVHPSSQSPPLTISEISSFITNSSIANMEDSESFSEASTTSKADWIEAWYQSILRSLPDIDFSYWLGWLLTPIALAFLLPIFLLILIYVSSFIVFA